MPALHGHFAMDLDATPFRYFLTVAEERSFTRAAQLLHVSQPALSAQIREFERRLGFALFQRTSRRVELTAEGRLFLGNARRMVAEASWANQAAREIRDNELRIGAPFYTLHIPERRRMMDTLVSSHADIRLRIFDKTHERHYLDLSRRELDLALLVEPADVTAAADNAVTEADWPGGMERQSLAERRLCLQIPREHPLAQQDTVPAAALDGLHIVLPNRSLGAPLSVAIGRAVREAGALTIRPPEGHPIAVERYGRLSRNIAVSLGWFDIHHDDDGDDVIVRPIDGLDLRTSLTLVRFHGEQRPAAAMVWQSARQLIAGAPAALDFSRRRQRFSQEDA